jgi:tetratricopeptide (TPR) repeat protein
MANRSALQSRSGALANQRLAAGFNQGFGNNGFNGAGFGYGGFGYGGFGGLGLLGLGYGLGYGGYGLGGYGGYGGYGGGGYGGNYASYPNSYGNDDNQLALATTSTAAGFDQAGEEAFRAGQYKEAAYDLRHALVDDPQNGTLAMMLAQALFAEGNFNEAAGATQMGMMLLPQDQWGVVVKNYKELYPSNAAYTEHLRGLEKSRNDKPDDPAVRFLLGFHYHYLGYPTQAGRELEKAVQLAPKDEFAKKLLGSIQGTSSSTAPAPAAPQPLPNAN